MTGDQFAILAAAKKLGYATEYQIGREIGKHCYAGIRNLLAKGLLLRAVDKTICLGVKGEQVFTECEQSFTAGKQ